MSETLASRERIVRIAELTRVEGEGGLYVRLDGDSIAEVRLDIFEPPRFFEAFLRGRHIDEVPDLTARICGICPVAYQMSSVHAFETALGVCVPPGIRRLRRLMYWAEYIESHALHIYLLNAPDFLGYDSALSLAADHREIVERALRLKKIGNELLEIIGGRPSHPVSVRIGGFHKVPRRADLLARRADLEWALETALATVAFVSRFAFPACESETEFVSLSHPDEYALNEGRIVSSKGLDIPQADYEKAFSEFQVPHSTALHSERSDGGGSYTVGPLARVNLQRDKLLPRARQAAKSCGIVWPSSNPFHGIVARAIELVQACEESLAILDCWEEPVPPAIPVDLVAGRGCAATEAPRGILYHAYAWDREGLVKEARISPPTAQNLGQIERDLTVMLPPLLERSDAEIASSCENLVRAYDPCISCSTHFLRLKIDR